MQMGFFGGLIVAFVGKSSLPEPAANFISSNPMLTFGSLFALNVAAGKLVNTGAFEVTYETAPGAAPAPCWSKLETGRFPSLEEITENIRVAARTSRTQLDGTDGAPRAAYNAGAARDEL